ncbi:MAG: hypothetical protein HY815_15550 [Candidatus Riflebacteria bacterium]|nr:hypothetical protein [Candidatus Riflebacteria bacterium]
MKRRSEFIALVTFLVFSLAIACDALAATKPGGAGKAPVVKKPSPRPSPVASPAPRPSPRPSPASDPSPSPEPRPTPAPSPMPSPEPTPGNEARPAKLEALNAIGFAFDPANPAPGAERAFSVALLHQEPQVRPQEPGAADAAPAAAGPAQGSPNAGGLVNVADKAYLLVDVKLEWETVPVRQMESTASAGADGDRGVRPPPRQRLRAIAARLVPPPPIRRESTDTENVAEERPAPVGELALELAPLDGKLVARGRVQLVDAAYGLLAHVLPPPPPGPKPAEPRPRPGQGEPGARVPAGDRP